jgi:hypothetical protein
VPPGWVGSGIPARFRKLRPPSARTEALRLFAAGGVTGLQPRGARRRPATAGNYLAGVTVPVVFVRTTTVSYRVSSSAKDSLRFGGWLVITMGR